MKSYSITYAASVLVLGALLTAPVCLASDQQPAGGDKPAASATDAKRIGGPYPLGVCPISGGKLGSMGDPIVKLYEGREVRFCCKSCPPKFEKNLTESMAKVDAAIIKDQSPLYPLTTSFVSGKELPGKPFEFVFGNRLVRLASEGEKAQFLKDPTSFLAALDKAVIAAQGKDYPLTTCPVSKDKLGGDMGDPVDLVVGGRLVRLCCKSCKKDVEQSPADVIAAVDDARKSAPSDRQPASPSAKEAENHKK